MNMSAVQTHGRIEHATSQLTLASATMLPTLSGKALRAHTMGSAYAAFEENVKGSLEPGKMADLAVWGANLYSIKPTDILNTKIEMTMIGGRVVYQA